MPLIHLETPIASNVEICFDLSRSIDLHKIATVHTKEEAIAGTTTGLINMGEFVTWKATHFGISQKLSSVITAFHRPFHFRDEQQKGIFQFIIHDHFFEMDKDMVCMKDVFHFRSPLGFLGRIADKLVLTNYLTKLLQQRNAIIKEFAETDKWKPLLTHNKATDKC
jgi:ligand-binding SRPBCC domain-containing protein